MTYISNEVVYAILLCAVVGLFIGRTKGMACTGLVLSLLLGPLGWVIVLCSMGNRILCQNCRGTIRKDASVCRHCASKVTYRGDNSLPDGFMAFLVLVLGMGVLWFVFLSGIPLTR